MKNVRKMVAASVFAALIAVCAWIAVPIPPVSFTLQTFGVLLALGVLEGRWGCACVGLYLLLGLMGLPVFSGFRGGASALIGPTGGFLWGFLAAALCYWALQRLGRLPAMIGAQLVCYVCGCLWFAFYAGGGFGGTLLVCVAPYLLPDAVKLALAHSVSGRLRRHLRL